MTAPFTIPWLHPFALPKSFVDEVGVTALFRACAEPEHDAVLRRSCSGSDSEVKDLRRWMRAYEPRGHLGYAFVVQPGDSERSLIVYSPPWRQTISLEYGKSAVARLGHTVASLFGPKHSKFGYCLEPYYSTSVFPPIPVDPIPHVLLPYLMVIHDADSGRAGLWSLQYGCSFLDGMDPW